MCSGWRFQLSGGERGMKQILFIWELLAGCYSHLLHDGCKHHGQHFSVKSLCWKKTTYWHAARDPGSWGRWLPLWGAVCFGNQRDFPSLLCCFGLELMSLYWKPVLDIVHKPNCPPDLLWGCFFLSPGWESPSVLHFLYFATGPGHINSFLLLLFFDPIYCSDSVYLVLSVWKKLLVPQAASSSPCCHLFDDIWVLSSIWGRALVEFMSL